VSAAGAESCVMLVWRGSEKGAGKQPRFAAH
jgi:hypothetical protein